MNGILGRFKNRRLLNELPPGPLRRLLESPPPEASTLPAQLKLLAIDLETTGLNPATDRILATGFVPIDGLAVNLATAGGMIVKADAEVGQSAVFHQITDDQVAQGRPLSEALDDILQAITGRVLLAHNADIEQNFLTKAVEQTYGVKVRFESLDTMRLAQAIIAPGFDQEPQGDDLRLWRSRARYGLPRYRGHQALTDAIACAELFLAQIAELGLETPYKKLRKIAAP